MRLSFKSLQSCLWVLNRNRDFFENHRANYIKDDSHHVRTTQNYLPRIVLKCMSISSIIKSLQSWLWVLNRNRDSFENHWTELAPKKLIATAWEQLITFHELSLSEHKFYYFNNRVVPDEELLKVYSPVCGFWSETEILFKITELSYKKADIHHVRTTNYLPRIVPKWA